MVPMYRVSLEARFWAKVHKTDGCWLWQAYVKSNGYGALGRGRRGKGMALAHRMAWELTNGPIPEGMTIDHLCKNRRCVNPAHLEVVSRGENTLRSSGPSAVNATKTHCIRGHSLEGARITAEGFRDCRECNKLEQRERRRKSAADEGRAINRPNSEKTVCKHGHSLADAYVSKGHRYCRTCTLAKRRKRVAA